ncbi:MAG: ATP-binding cassette domain-containing protein [Pirellulales bacterium]|nr:ATP-binding cassette domain-containing protein [Pirellulales bacterium]
MTICPTNSDHLVGIQCSDVRVAFADGTLGLDGLSADFAPGEITAILGPSGCGKSTLLRAVAGLVPVDCGQILFDGGCVAERRSDLAFVFQDAALLPWRTARENVQLPLELTGRLASHQYNSAVTQQLRQVTLTEEDEKKRPDQLSGGMRMRVSLARALVTEPSVLLLDEPFAALDELLRTRLGVLLHSLWQSRRRTVLFVTHNIAEAILLSHQILVMASGKVVERVANPLPFPRDANCRCQRAFGEVYSDLAVRLAEAQR